jgi:hypothetical protein
MLYIHVQLYRGMTCLVSGDEHGTVLESGGQLWTRMRCDCAKSEPAGVCDLFFIWLWWPDDARLKATSRSLHHWGESSLQQPSSHAISLLSGRCKLSLFFLDKMFLFTSNFMRTWLVQVCEIKLEDRRVSGEKSFTLFVNKISPILYSNMFWRFLYPWTCTSMRNRRGSSCKRFWRSFDYPNVAISVLHVQGVFGSIEYQFMLSYFKHAWLVNTYFS